MAHQTEGNDVACGEQLQLLTLFAVRAEMYPYLTDLSRDVTVWLRTRYD